MDAIAVDGIKATEQMLREQDKAIPSTMVIVSNHPHRFHLESTRSIVAYAVDGIGPTDFRGGMFGTIRQALRFRERHADFLALWESIEQHRHIPITFDGTSHHLAFGQDVPALLVGRQYSVPDANGALVTATLEDAVALPSQKLIYGIYRTQGGERFTCTNPMTEGEAKAYAENPDTFFGRN